MIKHLNQEGTINKTKMLPKYGLYDMYGDCFICSTELVEDSDLRDVYVKLEDVLKVLSEGGMVEDGYGNWDKADG